MIYIEDTIVEIEAGSVDDQTAQEVYRNLQVLYGTETGEQALDREFGIDINILDNPQEAAKALLTAEFVRKTKQYEPRVRVMRGMDPKSCQGRRHRPEGGGELCLISKSWQTCRKSASSKT